MKPAFALSFSATGISLHHHSDDDWFCIGTVAPDAPHLADQMQELRDKGFALENDLSCKVILPQDQIRFLTVSTEGMTPEQAGQQVQSALTGATPYDLSDLSFDTATIGAVTHVAAVARQTVREAREFCVKHGFIPLTFSVETSGTGYPDESEIEFPETAEQPATAVSGQEEPIAEETAPPVHSLAESPSPAAFRPPPPIDRAHDTKSGLTGNRQVLTAIAATVVVGVAIGAWSLIGGEDTDTAPEPEVAVAEPAPEPAAEEETPEIAETEPAADEQPDLTSTDAAILEALKVAPTPVEDVARDPGEPATQQADPALIFAAPAALEAPVPEQPEEVHLTSVDNADLSRDAIALPPVTSFDTDAPFDQSVLPSVAGTRFELDDRGLVAATPEGTLNPDGVMVFLGRPSSVPPEVPVRFEEEPIVDEDQLRLAGLRPRSRPGNLVENFERQQLGGRTIEELAVVRPKLRPKSVQERPQVDETPTALAVVRVPRPRLRPPSIAVIAARKSTPGTATLGSAAAIDKNDDEAGSFQPKTVAPKIPTTASVARQATMDNALNLRKLNLIGVYGTPANRRALVRLPSGRYKKFKVGDRIDGGKVVAIGDSELRYQKRGRNVTLKMPRG